MNLKRIDVPLKVHVNRNQLLLFFSRAARVLSLNFFAPIKLHYAREQKKSRFCSFSALSGAPRCVFSAHCGCSAFCFAPRRMLNSALLFLISSETLKLAQSRKLLWRERKRGREGVSHVHCGKRAAHTGVRFPSIDAGERS